MNQYGTAQLFMSCRIGTQVLNRNARVLAHLLVKLSSDLLIDVIVEGDAQPSQ